jgi:hypothetical protein
MIGLATRSRTESGSPPLQRKADFEANDPQQGDSVTGSPTPIRSGHFDMPAQHPELGDGAKLSAKSIRAPMKHLFRVRNFAALSPPIADRPSPGRSAAVASARRAGPLQGGDRGGRRAVASPIRDLTGLRGENRRPGSISSCSWFSAPSPQERKATRPANRRNRAQPAIRHVVRRTDPTIPDPIDETGQPLARIRT